MESKGKRLVNKVLNQENSPVPSSTCGLREIFFSPYHADASDEQKSMKNQEQEKTEWDKTENDVITKEDDTENNTTRRDNTMNTTAEEFMAENNKSGEDKTESIMNEEDTTRQFDDNTTEESKTEEDTTEENKYNKSRVEINEKEVHKTEGAERVRSDNEKWKIGGTDCQTRIKLTRILEKSKNVKQNLHRNSSSSSEADDTDQDPDFDINDECPKRKNSCKLLQIFKRHKSNSSNDSFHIPSTSRFDNVNININENNELSAQVEDENELNRGTPETVSERKGRKRKARPSEWIKTKNKILRNSGQGYTSYKSKKEFKAKAIRPACGEKCRLKCSSRVTEEQRKYIFEQFWALGDINRQRDFISKCLQEINPTYRYVRPESKRDLNNAFYFTTDEEKVRVCKQFFTATLDIPNRYIRTVVEKLSTGGFVNKDNRGKHGHHKTIDPAIKESVRKHINSIPRIESHYLRKQTTKEFIEGGKQIADLYRDYKQDCERDGIPFAHPAMYSHIFNNEFNLSFFIPKKDQCDQCIAYENADNETKKTLQERYDTHLTEKSLSREEKGRDKKSEDKNIIVACYDLQATFPIPKGDVSIFYYKSKLNCQNFTICDLKTKTVHCYTWHEGEGGRGVNELGTGVWKFLKDTSDAASEEVEVIFYSDNCWGQQKNKFMISMYVYAVTVLKIKSITHKFLIKGHTQNEGDSAHSVIERAVKKTLKSGPVYVPSQYVSIIRMAKKTGTPFKVNEMSHDDFIDFKQLYKDCSFVTPQATSKTKILKKKESKESGCKGPSKSTKKLETVEDQEEEEQIDESGNNNDEENKFMLSKALVVRVEKNQPTKILYKNSYSEQEFMEHQQKRKRYCKPTASIQLVGAYKKKPTIGERKKN